MEELRRGGRPAPRQSFTVPYIISTAVLALVAIALFVFFTMVRHVQDEQAASAIRGYKTRAVLCDMVKGLGLTESKECRDQVIQTYRDPNTGPDSTTGARNSQVTLKVVCALAAKLDVRVTECSG